MSCSNQIICYTSPHLSLHVPFFFLLIILTHCYVIVYSFYYPPLQAYLQYKKSLSNIIHLSHHQIQIHMCFQSRRETESFKCSKLELVDITNYHEVLSVTLLLCPWQFQMPWGNFLQNVPLRYELPYP